MNQVSSRALVQMVKIEQNNAFSQRKRPCLNLKCITPEARAQPPSPSVRVSSRWAEVLRLVQFDRLQEACEACAHRVAKCLQICSSQTSASLASQSLVKGRVETETTKTSSQEWVRPHPAPPAALHSLKCQYIIYAHEWLSIIHTPDPTRTRLLTTTPCFSLITSNAVSTLDTSRAFGFQTHHKQIK